MKKSTLCFLGMVLLVTVSGFSQTPKQQDQITKNYDQVKLTELETLLQEEFQANYEEALRQAAVKGWETSIDLEDGGQALLVGVFPDGAPKYYTTDNLEAAITTRTDRVHTGGTAGLNLNGEDMIAGIWDGGIVRGTHSLFNNRVSQIDNPGGISNHATHVAGTMIGNGEVLQGAVKGMAPAANLLAFSFFDDTSEMVNAAANGLLISNHSYGVGINNVPLWYLGYYDNEARNVDAIIYNAPFYLPVFSAGNDRQSGANNADGGFDYLTDRSVAKNNIVVAAVFEVLNYTQPSDVSMSSFSSWGPTDDGRIKPDISGKGVNVFSADGTSDNAYFTRSGTSMATPNVSGSLLLLQQHYNNSFGEFMLASSLRALALHTADEAGNNPGPDYRFGWGLLNTDRAAQVITNNGGTSRIEEAKIVLGGAYTFTFQADGSSEVAATIAWTDPAGNTLPAGNQDVATPSLIHDLDVRISQDEGATWMPWVLDVSSPSAGATVGDNVVDNVEKIEMGVLPAGEYIVRVSHKGDFLVDDEQVFSLIITGIVDESFFVSTEQANITACQGSGEIVFEMDVDFNDGMEGNVDFSVTENNTGLTTAITPASIAANGNVSIVIDDISSLAVGEYALEVTAVGVSETIVTYISLTIVDEIPISEVVLQSPFNGSGNRPVDGLDFSWGASTNTTLGYTLELALDEDFTTIVQTIETTELTATISGLEFDTQYFWRVKGANSCNEGDYSTVRNFTTETLLAIEDTVIQNLVVYPNPTQDTMFIEASVELATVTIYSVLGQQVLQQTLDGTIHTVDVSSLTTGTYFVQVTSVNTTSVLQIVKE